MRPGSVQVLLSISNPYRQATCTAPGRLYLYHNLIRRQTRPSALLLRSSSSVPASSSPPPSPSSSPQYPKRPSKQKHVSRTPDWLLKSPVFVAFIKGAARVLGTNSKTSTAIRETRTPYKRCAEREEIEEKFLYKDCHLPTTYQTWFQVTNLHVWLLTVRYRALPPPHGKSFVQELINHFFLNVEDRMREVLGKKVSERIIRGYMKEMRDQWAGSTASYDLAMVSSDADFAAAIWRNIFAARGEKGSNVAAEPSADSNAPTRAKDDELQLAELPYQLYLFTAYVRKETKRLERIKDEDVMGGKIGDFGRIGEGVGDWIDEAAEEDLKAKDRAGRTVQSQQKAAKRRAA